MARQRRSSARESRTSKDSSRRLFSSDCVEAARQAFASSEVVRELSRAEAMRGRGRPLTDEEVARLEANGCRSADWSRVKVAEGFSPEYVFDSEFRGEVTLGVFGAKVEVALAVVLTSGVYRSALSDCTVEDGALVRDVGVLSRTHVADGAVLLGVGELSGLAGGSYGCGHPLRAGVETGGREFMLYPEMTWDVARAVCTGRPSQDVFERYTEVVRQYASALYACPLSYIGRHAKVMHTAHLRGVYIGPHAIVDGARGIGDAAILSSVERPVTISSGASAYRSIVQEGAVISTGAVVEDSIVMQHAQVSKNACVVNSVVGPCSVAEKCEITSSFVGPLTGVRHQSLLVSVLWPEGRGTLGAGALVGANHTGRASDQEGFLSEGLFVGMGVRAEFPCDLSRASYSIIAAGTHLPPQRIEMPFSLVRRAHGELVSRASPPGSRPVECEILPGWVLAESPYTLLRAAKKNAERYAVTGLPIDADPLRPEVLALVKAARDALSSLPEKDFYGPHDLAGLGANVMTAGWRQRAVETYGTALRRKSLEALVAALLEAPSEEQTSLLRARLGEALEGGRLASLHPLHRQTLADELGGVETACALEEYISLSQAFAEAVEKSKAKDDARGARIQPEYASVHTPAAEDEVVLLAHTAAEKVAKDVAALLSLVR